MVYEFRFLLSSAFWIAEELVKCSEKLKYLFEMGCKTKLSVD